MWAGIEGRVEGSMSNRRRWACMCRHARTRHRSRSQAAHWHWAFADVVQWRRTKPCCGLALHASGLACRTKSLSAGWQGHHARVLQLSCPCASTSEQTLRATRASLSVFACLLQRRHKEELERRLAEIEEARRIFSRPSVLVQANT